MHPAERLFSSFYNSANSANILCSNFEMMPQKTDSRSQDLSHLATPLIGAHRSRGFSHPVANHSALVCSLSLAERGLSLLPVSPLFVARLGFFLRLLLRASFGDVVWRRVASVQPASRQTTCCRLGNKTLGAVCTANHLALLTKQAGGVTERD